MPPRGGEGTEAASPPVVDREPGNREQSILSDSAQTLFLWALVYVVGLGTSVLISRRLGPLGRGEYYLPVVAAATMVSVCKLGLEQANVFLLGTRKLPLERLSGQNGFVALAAGGVGVTLLLLTPMGFPGLFADTPVLLLLLAALTIPFSLHTQFSAGLLTLRGQVTWQFRATLVAGLIQVALLLGLLAFGWFQIGPVLMVNLIVAMVTWGITVRPLRRTGAAWIRWDRQLLGQTFKHSLLIHAGMVLFFLHLRLDMFMVKAIAGTAALGRYSISVALAETLLVATDSLSVAVLPRQVGNTLRDAASLALRGARTNVLLGAGVALFWVVAGMGVISVLFGSAFAPAYLPLVGLLPGMIFLGVQRMCGAPTLRAGRAGMFPLIYGVSLLCNAALNLWWIPRWGALGAALASSVSYGFGAVLFLAWTARLAGAPLRAGLIPTWPDVTAFWRAAEAAVRRVHGIVIARRQAARPGGVETRG